MAQGGLSASCRWEVASQQAAEEALNSLFTCYSRSLPQISTPCRPAVHARSACGRCVPNPAPFVHRLLALEWRQGPFWRRWAGRTGHWRERGAETSARAVSGLRAGAVPEIEWWVEAGSS